MLPALPLNEATLRDVLWVVEDSPLEAEMARQVLAARYDLEFFAEGLPVLERLASGPPPSALLLDATLPDTTGREVCRALREHFDEASLPVLFLTAQSDPEDVLAGLDAGANDYMTKPYRGAELLARVATLVRVGRLHASVKRLERDRAELLARERAARSAAEAERQRVEVLAERVQQSEAQWRLLTDALPVLVSFVTADERYGLVNKAYEDWFGLSREALLGRPVREIIGEAAYAVMSPFVARALAGEQFSFEQRGVPYRLGGTRDVRVSFVPHRDPAGAVDGYVALLEDVTTQRHLAAEREQLAGQRTEVLESMGDAFFALDRDWRFVLVNQRYEELSGRGRDETLGRVFWGFTSAFDPDSPYARALRRCMDDRVAVQFVEHSSSLDRWTDARVFPTADGGVSVFLRDVTAARRADEALKRQAEFEQQLIGIVSHDLRNPLNVIQMSSSLLLQDEGLDEHATRFVVRIRNAAERATRMVRDLLDFTQARLGGGIGIERQRADVHQIVGQAIDEIETAFPERHLDFAREGDGGGEWDPDRLAQVVQNLVTNALKYSPPDSLVRVVTRAEGDEVTLLVHNEGVPIPAEKLPVLFEPFQRVAGHADRASRSVGLGLYIVRHIVEAHRGAITVRSTEAEGTSFLLRLPRLPTS
jgi:phosphoserine phosphatase RsbU/P